MMLATYAASLASMLSVHASPPQGIVASSPGRAPAAHVATPEPAVLAERPRAAAPTPMLRGRAPGAPGVSATEPVRTRGAGDPPEPRVSRTYDARAPPVTPKPNSP